MTFDPNLVAPSLYVERMAKPLIDKLFFVDKVEADLYVDYGCADGTLVKFLRMLNPEARIVGYDISEDMLVLAREQVPGVIFTSDWAEVRRTANAVQAAGGRTCLVLSSVIHEVYAYSSEAEVATFWDRVRGGNGEPGFDVVAVRDMMVARAASRPADPLAAARVRQVFDATKVAEWEATWGGLDENWSLVHFLLTCPYVDNWNRELHENYLPISVEDFVRRFPFEYAPTYREHFAPPFLARRVMKQFGFRVPDPTHLKLIMERG